MSRTCKIGTGLFLAMSILSMAYFCSIADNNELPQPAVVPVADRTPWLESLGGEGSAAMAMTNSDVAAGYRRFCQWTYFVVEKPVFDLCQRWVPESW